MQSEAAQRFKVSVFTHMKPKLNLYADDVTLLLSDTPGNTQWCLQVIKDFGDISGLRLNSSKTEYCDLGL